jgi:hypothetical protein
MSLDDATGSCVLAFEASEWACGEQEALLSETWAARRRPLRRRRPASMLAHDEPFGLSR